MLIGKNLTTNQQGRLERHTHNTMSFALTYRQLRDVCCDVVNTTTRWPCWRSTQEPDEQLVTQLFAVFLCWCVNRIIVLSCWLQHNITDTLTDCTREENVKVKQTFHVSDYRTFLSMLVLGQWQHPWQTLTTFSACDNCQNSTKIFRLVCGFCYYTDKIASTEWRDLVWVIYFLHWGFCALLFIKSSNFSTHGNHSSSRLLQENQQIFGSDASVVISLVGEMSIITVRPFSCPHFWRISFWSFFQRNMRTSPVDFLWRAVINRECFALDLSRSSRLVYLVNHGFPRHACQDLSASISRMHACHFESSLDLRMYPIFWTNFTDSLISMLKAKRCWNMMTVLERHEVRNVHCTCNCVPILHFSPQMSIRALSKAHQSIDLLTFHRIITLLRTDQNHEQNSCVLVCLNVCHVTARSRCRVCGPSPRSIHAIWAQNLLLSVCIFHSTLLRWQNLLVVRFPQAFLKTGRARISLLFWDNASRLSLSFSSSSFVSGASWEFHCVFRRWVSSRN